ncbi:MAG: HipA family kinase [Nocardioidaceae bacterium]
MLTRVDATRYVTPLREGGSLPALVEACDLGTYVMKFHGAGQGVRVLAAEVIVAGLARRLQLRVPDLVALSLSPAIARYEPDEEVQDLLNASLGLNLGVDFLPGSFGFDAHSRIPEREAAAILWLDAFVANVDRSWRNPNLLMWHGRVWCIDHGAALYFHHAWPQAIGAPEAFAAQPYDVSDHVLRASAAAARRLDASLAAAITPDALDAATADVPDEWLPPLPGAPAPAEQRRLYVEFLTARLAHRDAWLPGGALP